jgi:pilus assembly protein Flp/PilA
LNRTGEKSKEPIAGAFGCPKAELDMSNLFHRFLEDRSGATAIEYGLIAALIAVVIIGTLTAIGTNLSTTLNSVSTNLH